MNEKMNGGISTLRGIFCRLSFQKGGITAETIAAQGFDGGIFSVDTRQKGMTFLRHAFFLCLFLHARVLSGPAAAVQTAADFLCSLSAYFTDL